MQVSFSVRSAVSIVGVLAAILLGVSSDNASSSENASESTPADGANSGNEVSAEEFLQKASTANMTEINLGELAKKRTSNPDVKQFAQRMVKDHTRNLDLVRRIASGIHINLPDTMEPSEQSDAAKLEKLSGSQFDQAYAQDMVQDHTKDVAEFERAASKIKDPAVKTYAQLTLPILRHHLKMAQEMNDSLKSTVSQKTEEKTNEPLQTTTPESQPAR